MESRYVTLHIVGKGHAMTSETCLQKAIEIAESKLEKLPEDVKEAIISYSGSLYTADNEPQ